MGGSWNCITTTNAQPNHPRRCGYEAVRGRRPREDLNGDKDDEGTVLDVDERTEMVIVYLGRHAGGWAFHRDDLRKVRVH